MRGDACLRGPMPRTRKGWSDGLLSAVRLAASVVRGPAHGAACVGILAATLAVSFATLEASAASTGPQPGMTGAPAIAAQAAEGTCVSCHTSFPLNPDPKGAIALEGAPASYEPGRSYTLTFRVSHDDPAILRWGFQMTAVALRDGEGAGEFVASDPVTTQVLPSMSSSRTYVEHAYGGTGIGQAGGLSWTFEWKAPATDVGAVGFFAAANASNVDGSNQGDRVYSKSPSPIAESRGPGG